MKRDIEIQLFQIYRWIGIDKPSNHEEILSYVHEDVATSADQKHWHSGDVAIAFRRWIESKS